MLKGNAVVDTLILNKDGTPLSLLPLSIVRWQVSIRLLTLDKVSVLKNHNSWIVRSPSISMHVPSVVITKNFIKWNRFVKYNRQNVYLRDDFSCQFCGTKAPAEELTLDHVLPRSHGGKTTWTNIVTSCRSCNERKGNNKSVKPKKAPYKPSYYEIVSKSQQFNIRIRDKDWLYYIDWPTERIKFIPPPITNC